VCEDGRLGKLDRAELGFGRTVGTLWAQIVRRIGLQTEAREGPDVATAPLPEAVPKTAVGE
jgi:hypothetical protein